ncbi:MAG: hypothetical protein AABO57_10415 [Acidobacteriota bacterium]
MNCHELNSVVNDLARDQMMDASLREKALSHAASCAGCATRLADERALTTGLRRVAEAVEEAPRGVETALLAAFREQHSTMTVPFASARSTVRRWVYLAAGVAAAAAIVMALWLSASRSRDLQQPVPQKADGTAAPASPNDRLAAPKPLPSPAIAGPRFAVDRAPNRVRGTPGAIKNDGRSQRAEDSLNESSGDLEIATDFIPLMNRDSLAQLDSGQVMRVELPRSALISFGLPMNMERANERIKADVVVGNDGLARAIRFVH